MLMYVLDYLYLTMSEILTEPDVLVGRTADIGFLDAVDADLLSLVESLNDVDMLVESIDLRSLNQTYFTDSDVHSETT